MKEKSFLPRYSVCCVAFCFMIFIANKSEEQRVNGYFGVLAVDSKLLKPNC